MFRIVLAAAAVALLPAAALAHVSASPSQTAAGAYTQAAFRIGHGCSPGAATTSLRIEIPPALDQARPRAIPGWTLAIEKSREGRTTAVTWTGRLPDERFEVFELLFKAPAQTGALVFPAVQTCGKEQATWIETPEAAKAHPAPVIQVTPAADPHAGHH